ncbi:hypothetical protein ACH4MM_09535 [Streptomyces pratensis]|uniref:hypothetical protein n=1 Tax=Streptomyces pratensis TaxID=1169025 RepID=UPI0037AC7BC4
MLTLRDERFRFAGTRMYRLGSNENVGGAGHPTYSRIDDAPKTARVMNATFVRAHKLGTSLGCEPCTPPEPGEFDEGSFAPVDHAVARSRPCGLRPAVPFADRWDRHHGGYRTMAKWLGLHDLKDFRTDPRLCGLAEKHVDTVLPAGIGDRAPMRPSVMRLTPTLLAGQGQYRSPMAESALSRVETGTEAMCATGTGPQVLLCLAGEARPTSGPVLSPVAPVFVPAGSSCELTGTRAVLHHARAPFGGAS